MSINKDADVLTKDIGDDTKIHKWAYIEGDVKIGHRCVIKPFTYIPDGTVIGNDVFIGMGVTICNDKHPIPLNPGFILEGVVIHNGASIGANVTILPGVAIGVGATVGAGSVVTNDVPNHATVVGNPAKVVHYK